MTLHVTLYLSVCMCLLCVLLQGGQVVFHVIVRWESIAISPEEGMSITPLVSLFSSTVIQTPAAPTETFFIVANICQGCKHWHVSTGEEIDPNNSISYRRLDCFFFSLT